MKTQSSLSGTTLLHNFGSRKSFTWKKKQALSVRMVKLIRKHHVILGGISAMIFTGTLFLGGSYLFFVQLAEYGW